MKRIVLVVSPCSLTALPPYSSSSNNTRQKRSDNLQFGVLKSPTCRRQSKSPSGFVRRWTVAHAIKVQVCGGLVVVFRLYGSRALMDGRGEGNRAKKRGEEALTAALLTLSRHPSTHPSIGARDVFVQLQCPDVVNQIGRAHV